MAARSPQNKNPPRNLQAPPPDLLPLLQSSPLFHPPTQNHRLRQLLLPLHSLREHQRLHRLDPRAAASLPPCLLSALARGMSRPKLNPLLQLLQYKVSQALTPPKTTTTQPRLLLPPWQRPWRSLRSERILHRLQHRR